MVGSHTIHAAIDVQQMHPLDGLTTEILQSVNTMPATIAEGLGRCVSPQGRAGSVVKATGLATPGRPTT